MDDILSWLSSVPSGSLEETRAFCEILNSPQLQYKVIHIAGTNGKGSVCVKTSKSLERVGYKVGLFTSPHITEIRERIRVNSVMIPEEDFIRLAQNLWQIQSENNLALGWFTFYTLIAFLYFAEQAVDWAVIEVGVGGRLDNTNIVAPAICAITSISLDHTELLGSTIEEITMEKAGIIKPGVPVVLGPSVRDNLIRESYPENSLIKLRSQFKNYENYLGENKRIAEQVLKTLIDLNLLDGNDPSLWTGLDENAEGRMELIVYKDRKVVIDVSHNPAGVNRFIGDTFMAYPNFEVEGLIGMTQGKMSREMMDVIADQVPKIHVVSVPGTRMIPYQELAELVNEFDPESLGLAGEFSDVFERVTDQLQDDTILLAFGTFPLIKAIKSHIARSEDL